jgi:hypothetical protein
MTRVEVSLTEPADFSVVSTDEGLAIELVSLAGGAFAELSGEEGGEGWAEESDPWAIEPMPEETPEAAPQMPPIEEAPPATILGAIEVQDLSGGSLIHLRADGVVSSAVTFTLEDPDRSTSARPTRRACGWDGTRTRSGSWSTPGASRIPSRAVA